MIDVDPEIAAGLDRMVAGADGAAPDWDDVLGRAAVGGARRRAWTGRLLVPAIGLAIGGLITLAVLRHGPSVSSGGAGSCAAVARYHGATYVGEGVRVAPVHAGSAGTAVLPSCDDGSGPPVGPQTIRVDRIRGVSPRVAFVQVGFQDAIYVRSSRAAHPPKAVVRLEHAPSCLLADAPIRLEGRWLGILRPNGDTELTMRPPYDIDLFAEYASPARYLRAFLTVRVPASLGRPLSEADIHGSLQKGGTIAVTATCARGRYVAQRVKAFPPR